ncbi:hypothetical protein EI555_000845 [Monodon monoceros]|uniref:RING-type E3 ubiquitin transferase n=1 Tax=Monodon monoceros TaxID=40151 RepID=A0A4U1F0D1_MONMO|nr:hypothetical protein EI555_000845 [Monodon monoceros]
MALRSGNKECPTCGKKLVSKRSLRPDPNFDALISKIYPSREEYEAHQDRVLIRLSHLHNQQVLSSSTEEGLRMQAMHRAQHTLVTGEGPWEEEPWSPPSPPGASSPPEPGGETELVFRPHPLLVEKGEYCQTSLEGVSEKQYTIYIAPGGGAFMTLNGSLTLELLNEKFWKVSQPLELCYALTKDPK